MSRRSPNEAHIDVSFACLACRLLCSSFALGGLHVLHHLAIRGEATPRALRVQLYDLLRGEHLVPAPAERACTSCIRAFASETSFFAEVADVECTRDRCISRAIRAATAAATRKSAGEVASAV